MDAVKMVETPLDLERFGNVAPEGYLYSAKIITPGADLILPTAILKWYDLYPEDAKITPEQDAETRAFLTAEVERLHFEGDLGFVILHRAGSVLLLLLTTWRNTNEMWEAVWVNDLTGGGYVPVIMDSAHKPTYCVWELAAVWHERDAWVRFLSSKRDVSAKRAYIDDRFSGRA